MKFSPKLPALPALRVLMLSPACIASCQIMNTMFRGLHDQGALSYLCLYDNESEYPQRHDAVEWADVIFFFRAYDPQAVSLLRLAKEAGKGTIYCTDDDFLQLDRESSLGKIHHAPENIQAFQAMVCEADLVWLFTEEMVKRYREFNPRIVLGKLPSPFELFPVTAGRPVDNELTCTIGYAGGFTHQKDLLAAIRPLLRLLEEHPQSLRVEFIGCIPDKFLRHPQVKHIPYFENLIDFYSYMAKARWTIGVGLLEDTPFNRGKTNNKYREYAAFGIPGIYSDMPMYSSCVKHRINGYLTANTEEGIAEALSTMLKDGELRKTIRKAALQDITCSYSLKAAQLQLLHEMSSLAIEKINSSTKPKFLVVGYGRVSTTHIDALQPCHELSSRNLLDFVWREPGKVLKQDIDMVDGVYLVRAFEPSNLAILEWAQQKQRPMICSWDDNFFMVPENTPLGQFLVQPEVRIAMEKFLRECSLIITSTPPLAAHSRTFNQNVMEAIYGLRAPDSNGKSGHTSDSRTHRVRIGFFGMNQGIDTPFMIDALKEIRRRYENRIAIETIGLKGDQELTGVIDSHFDIVWNYDDALRLLKSRQWDIGLAPLLDTEFNAAKQATKFRDYAWCGAAIIASDVPTYRRTIVDGIHGFLVENTPSAWIRAMISLIEDSEKRLFLSTGAKRLLNNVHMQDKTIASWYQLIWRILKFKLDKLSAYQSKAPQSITSSSQNEIVESPSSPPVTDLLLRSSLSYHVVLHHANWNGIDVLIGTHQQAATGVLKMRVLSETGHPLREISVDLGHARDNHWLEFRFSPIANSVSIPFVAEFTIINPGPQTRISFYENNPRERATRRLLRRTGIRLPGNELYCRRWYAK